MTDAKGLLFTLKNYRDRVSDQLILLKDKIESADGEFKKKLKRDYTSTLEAWKDNNNEIKRLEKDLLGVKP